MNDIMRLVDQASKRDSGHELRDIGKYTQRRARWEPSPGGGQVPVYEPLEEPYFLYYCECGTVGGRTSSETMARAAHQRHVGEMTDV
jgi:hypothetical protein